MLALVGRRAQRLVSRGRNRKAPCRNRHRDPPDQDNPGVRASETLQALSVLRRHTPLWPSSEGIGRDRREVHAGGSRRASCGAVCAIDGHRRRRGRRPRARRVRADRERLRRLDRRASGRSAGTAGAPPRDARRAPDRDAGEIAGRHRVRVHQHQPPGSGVLQLLDDEHDPRTVRPGRTAGGEHP